MTSTWERLESDHRPYCASASHGEARAVATWRMEAGEVGGYFCADCKQMIRAQEAPCEGCSMDFQGCCAVPVAAPHDKRIAELEDALTGAEIVIRMLAPTGQETTLATIRRALRRDQ